VVPIDLTTVDPSSRHFDVVINAAGYGVVKTEADAERGMQINYIGPSKLFDSVADSTFWIQVGTGFEYNLDNRRLTEQTPCNPKTVYGISKFMMSHYLLSHPARSSVIVRPFAMYGPREHPSKIVPYLIESQLHLLPVALSSGEQRRDYVYVGDVGTWIAKLVQRHIVGQSIPLVINVGSGQSTSIRELAIKLSNVLPRFDPELWQWGAISGRANESDEFYNASTLATEFGFVQSDSKISLQSTVNYYDQL
jgi:nucleoside-diphosphate-sugar epimerase